MLLFHRWKNMNAEVRLPFIGDSSAAFARLKTSLYVNTPGLCTQSSLRRLTGLFHGMEVSE